MTQTIYIRCAALHNRGDLVNKFFFQHRSVLGIEEWYTDEQLIPTSPVEIVEVKYSRKPYFLVEFREPLQEELLLRRTMPNDAIELSCQEEELSRISVALLQLGETVKELDGSSLIIMPAMDGVTVFKERMKLKAINSKRKRERESESGARNSEEKTAGADTLSFVPRTVRRRQ